MDYLGHVGTNFKTIAPLNAEKLRRLSAGLEVVDLSMINPDIKPARVLTDKLLEAINKAGTHRYSVSKGIRKFRSAIAQKYRDSFEVLCNPDDNICSTLGSKDAFQQVLKVLGAQDCKEVLLPSPCYPAHLTNVELQRMTPRYFQVSEDEGAMLQAIESQLSSYNIGAVLLNFPNNPTGVCVSASFYEALVKMAQKYNALLVNDFVYGEMAYNGRPCASLLSTPGALQCSVEVFSMSKAYSIPGWRIGALLGNTEIIKRVSRLKSLVDYGVYLPLQLASASALVEVEDIVSPVVATYKRRMQVFEAMCDRLELEHITPTAGCSFWLKLPKGSGNMNATEFCLLLLKEQGLCFQPGAVFGSEWEQWVRVALVASEERLQRVADRLSGEINAYKQAA